METPETVKQHQNWTNIQLKHVHDHDKLRYAVQDNDYEKVESLLESGVDANIDGSDAYLNAIIIKMNIDFMRPDRYDYKNEYEFQQNYKDDCDFFKAIYSNKYINDSVKIVEIFILYGATLDDISDEEYYESRYDF